MVVVVVVVVGVLVRTGIARVLRAQKGRFLFLTT